MQSSNAPMRVVLFASGRGSNARTIMEMAYQQPKNLEVVALITNKATAPVVQVAERYGIPSHIVPVRRQETGRATRLEHESRIHEVLKEYEWEYICLAGYMRIFTPDFVEAYPHPDFPVSRIINIHPSMLPAFKGASAYDDAFNYGVKVSGITVHFVSAGVDEGVIIAQESFERLPNDDLSQFKARGLSVEHRLYPNVLLSLSRGDFVTQSDPFSIFLTPSS